MNNELMELALLVTADEKAAIDALLRDMRSRRESSPIRNRHFLCTPSQQIIYKERVLIYYSTYLAGREVPHMTQMLHYAAIYHVLAQRMGIRQGEFYGPDFDHFLYDYCGISYNSSSKPRGRYRQVGDVYKEYSRWMLSGCVPGDEGKCAKLNEYRACIRDFQSIVGTNHNVSYHDAKVPKMH